MAVYWAILALKFGQASKWASFFSSISVSFGKMRLFWERLRHVISTAKQSMLTVSLALLRNVTVVHCWAALSWKQC